MNERAWTANRGALSPEMISGADDAAHSNRATEARIATMNDSTLLDLEPEPNATDGAVLLATDEQRRKNPRPVITGVTELVTPVRSEIENVPNTSGCNGTVGHLDWLSVTYPAALPLVYSDLLPEVFRSEIYQLQGRGRYGYRHQYANPLGVTVLDGSQDDRMGMHMVIGGQALENIRRAGVTDRALCQHVVGNRGKLTRLDVAIDLHGGNLTYLDIYNAYNAGELKTNAKSGAMVQRSGASAGGTVYLGSRSSDRLFRAYDKAAEQNIVDAGAWLRLELELKKLWARGIAGAIAQEEDTRTVINASFRDFVEWPASPEFTEAISGDDVALPLVPRKMTDTYRWLLEQVPPVLARYHVEHPDDNILFAFMLAVQLELQSLEGSNQS